MKEFLDIQEFDGPDYDFFNTLKEEFQVPKWMTMETHYSSKGGPMTDLEYALAKSEEEEPREPQTSFIITTLP